MTFVGIDGCRSAWIAIALAPDGAVTAHHLPRIEAVTTAVPDAEVVAIDIPIGLPVAGQREADLAAKAAAVDDVLDAAVVAWTARRIASGAARSFPPNAGRDDAAIWA